jgi:hypothetical protein
MSGSEDYFGETSMRLEVAVSIVEAHLSRALQYIPILLEWQL